MLEAKDVSKTFRVIDRRTGLRGMLQDVVRPRWVERSVLRELSCTIDSGNRVCIAGRNGSGKSTLLKIFAGAMLPTSGQVELDGTPIKRLGKAYKQQIGLVFGHRGQLFWELALAESLEFLRYVYRIEAREYRDRIEFFASALDLAELLNKPVREMSLGQRTRCEIAAALLHHPRILILDEATIGLDVAVKKRIYDMLNAVAREEECTLIFSTHDIHDITTMADRLVVIHNGQFVYDGTPADFLEEHRSGQKLRLKLHTPVDDPGSLLPDSLQVQESEESELVVLGFDRAAVLAAVQDPRLMDRVEEVVIEEESLHDVLGRFYETS